MSGRMNWDRVRKDTLSLLHGSEWVNPFADSRPKKNKKKKKNTRRSKVIPLNARMDGCTCGKPIGFTGQHKKRCPLCQRESSIATRSGIARVPSTEFPVTSILPSHVPSGTSGGSILFGGNDPVPRAAKSQGNGREVVLTPAARKGLELRQNQLATARKVLELRRSQLSTATRENTSEPVIRITKSQGKKRFRVSSMPDWHLNSDK
jgi:hypothetical protein